MKVNLISSINISKLDRAIVNYKQTNGHDPYIFVNDETAEAINKELIPDWMLNSDTDDYYVVTDSHYVQGKKVDKSCVICFYQGIKVYYNEDLKFGEVELR